MNTQTEKEKGQPTYAAPAARPADEPHPTLSLPVEPVPEDSRYESRPRLSGVPVEAAPPEPGTPSPSGTGPAPLMEEDGSFAPEWYSRFEELQPFAATLAKFRRPEALAKSYAHLERLRGYPEQEDSARMAAFRAAVGLPEDAAAYALPRPEGTPDEVWDDALAAALSHVAYEYGVPARAMAALTERYAQEGTRMLEACRDAQQQAIERADAELQQDWGRHYEENMESIGNYLAALGERSGVDVRHLVENSALRASADFARLMLAAAAEQQEAPLREGEATDSRQEARRIVSDPSHPLHEAYMRVNHPRHRYANEQYDRLAFGRRL